MSDPAYVRAFKELTGKQPLTLADIDLLEKEIYGISDRASAMLLAALVESALKEAIKSVLRPDLSNALTRDLFDFEGPIGTFASKIRLAYALNLFGPATYHDLDLIRLIRNGFAHFRYSLAFDMPVVRAVCDHLQLPDHEVSHDESLVMSVTKYTETKKAGIDLADPRTRYRLSCHHVTTWAFVFSLRYRDEKPIEHGPYLP